MDSTILLIFIALLSFALSFVGATVGLVLGHFRLPLLAIYLSNLPTAAACNLLISGCGATAGAIRHVREGRFNLPCLLIMGLPSLLGAMVASYLFVIHLSPFWSNLIIGFMLVYSGWNMTQSSKIEPNPNAKPNYTLEAIIGLGIGALAAITGLMLGSLRLPMMIRLLGIDPKQAIGTNMVIGSATGLCGAITTLAWSSSLGLDWAKIGFVLAFIIPPTVLGGWMGGWFTGSLKKEQVNLLAGWLIAVTGAIMVVEAVLPLRSKPTAEVTAWIETDDTWPGEFDPDDD